MAGAQISTGVTIISSLKGYQAISLTNFDTSAATAIASGSVVEIAGAFFTWASDETPSGWSAIATTATAFIVLTPAGAAGSQTVSASYTSTAPVWRDDNQGWYATAGSTIRYIGSVEKTSATQYDNKALFFRQNSYVEPAFGGGEVGAGASATASGGAVGRESSATSGGAVGKESSATAGGAVGRSATTTFGGAVGDQSVATTTGGAVGNSAQTTTGGAVGNAASSTTGFAGGDGASNTEALGVDLCTWVKGYTFASTVTQATVFTVISAHLGDSRASGCIGRYGVNDISTVQANVGLTAIFVADVLDSIIATFNSTTGTAIGTTFSVLFVTNT